MDESTNQDKPITDEDIFNSTQIEPDKFTPEERQAILEGIRARWQEGFDHQAVISVHKKFLHEALHNVYLASGHNFGAAVTTLVALEEADNCDADFEQAVMNTLCDLEKALFGTAEV